MKKKSHVITFEEYEEMQKRRLLTFEEYCDIMKSKYKDKLEAIDGELMMAGSFSRGQLLYDILESSRLENELKYYVFLNWWDSIDSCHEKFGDNVKKWLDAAKVKLSFNDLTVDEDGYVKVYRGTNEFSRSWMGMSWTTDKYIALKFAEGARVRMPVQSPAILVGRVHVDAILGVINSRNESEIICYYTESDKVLYPDSEEYQEIEVGLEEHMEQIQKETDRQIAEMVEKMKIKKEVPQCKKPTPEQKAKIDEAKVAFNKELELIKQGKTDLTRMEELRKKHRNLIAEYCMTDEQKANGEIPF
ncbi:hypothetical protein HBE96_17280 [Clostridium sp. P21]|uniref:Uncharacterized protein n=1 Tax=Clostridium muellerianum TaxID=2716538 RepID=A0A7Y0EL14_9CLOT|nr:hypothetical protein [Clostridium muellerianum]NMM64375.1 hypothetical protein [Clostridium muellerianum]